MHYTAKVSIGTLRSSLFLVAAALLLLLPAAAAADGGSRPSAAVEAEASNSGSLAPTEQQWYQFTMTDDGERAVRLVITPNVGNTVNFVTLGVFEENQIPRFSQGDTGNMVSFSTGQVTQTGDPDTGEIALNSSFSDGATYYIQILNESDFDFDYTLFLDEPIIDLEEPEDVEDVVEPAEVIAQAGIDPNLLAVGIDPANPAVLDPGKIIGKVAPNTTQWYEFSYHDFSGQEDFKELDYTVFFTPDDGHRRHRLNFELYSAREFEQWRRGEIDELHNFGAGMLSPRADDPNIARRSWNGSVLMGDQYLMAVSNGNDVEVDYTLYSDDIGDVNLGPTPVPQAARKFAPGLAPETAFPLEFGVNKGGLDPGEEIWYSFRIANFDENPYEDMALTMITTPDDGNRIRRMTFDVFTGKGVNGWSPGDNSRINNMGAGSVVYRDNSPVTGERFWTGWIVDNDLYYVQVRNGTEAHMDYWLFTGDVYRPPLGEEPEPVAKVAAAPGKAPGSAIPLKVDINDGQLGPGEEEWYTFTRGDVSEVGSVETVFTLIFTPDDGNRIRKVNFQLFEGNQLRDWAPDNRFGIVGFGSGNAVRRDSNPTTGELIWNGHVISGDRYYMRVSNESDATIDYKIYPEDVINTSLEPR